MKKDFKLVEFISDPISKRSGKFKQVKTSFLFVFLLLQIISKASFAQSWQIINYTDCHLVVTLTCPGTGASQSSDTYDPMGPWWGQWDGAQIGNHNFNTISCNCADPQIKIEDLCSSPTTILYQGSIAGSNGIHTCCCNYTYPDCADMNKCFEIQVSGCTITFAKPPGPSPTGCD